MPVDNIIALCVFAGVLVCTPGPVNILLMTAGADRGVRACLPLMAGVMMGKSLLHISLALGLWWIINIFPEVLFVMKIAGAIYIIWLAYKIMQFKVRAREEAEESFVAGFIVSLLNPKAWAMVVLAYGQFIVMDGVHDWWTQTIIIASVFFSWSVAHMFWCWGGAHVSQVAADAKWKRYILTFLSALMVGVVLWSLIN